MRREPHCLKRCAHPGHYQQRGNPPGGQRTERAGGPVGPSRQVTAGGNGRGEAGGVLTALPGKRVMILGPSLQGLIHIQYRNYSNHFVKQSKKFPENLSNNYSLVAKGMAVTSEGLKWRNYSNRPPSRVRLLRRSTAEKRKWKPPLRMRPSLSHDCLGSSQASHYCRPDPNNLQV